MNEVLILDVGHGNAAIVKHNGQTVVIDAPLKDHLIDALTLEGIDRVRLAVASHSDSDHCGGFIGLLLDPRIVVEELRINSDATRQTQGVRRKFWEDLKVAWLRAKKMHGTKLRIELTDHATDDISLGSLRLEVLYPPAELALGGVGSLSAIGKTVTPNAMSVVIRVVMDGVPLVLLPGDMDAAALRYLIANRADLSAHTLVFPHHGGNPEGATSSTGTNQFVTDLLNSCNPSTVLFSIGRGLHRTPRPEIIKTIRKSNPTTHIGCTQLSSHCADELLPNDSHLSSRYAAGRLAGSCCLGTSVLTGEGVELTTKQLHQAAIAHLPGRLCL
jgi:beta-lactamase superfamily II metal-dependent hydrolase